MAIDPRASLSEWNTLLETLHKDAGDKEMFEKNLPEINDLVNELSKEKFRSYNPEIYNDILALKQEISSIDSSRPVNEAQATALSQAVEKVYSIFKSQENAKSKGEAAPAKAPSGPPKTFSEPKKPSSVATSGEEPASKYTLPPSSLPTTMPKGVAFQPYTEQIEYDEKESSVHQQADEKESYMQKALKARAKEQAEIARKFQPLIESILDNQSDDYSARVVQMSKFVEAFEADATFKLNYFETYPKIQALGKKLEEVKNQISVSKEANDPGKELFEVFGEVLKMSDEIYHSFLKETYKGYDYSSRYLERDKERLSNFFKGYHSLENQVSFLQKEIDSLESLSKFPEFASKLTKLKQDIDVMQSNKSLMTGKKIDELFKLYKEILTNADKVISREIRNYDPNKKSHNKSLLVNTYLNLGDALTRYRKLRTSEFHFEKVIFHRNEEQTARVTLSNLGELIFNMNEENYAYDYPQISEKIKKLKADIKHFLGTDKINAENASKIFSANIEKFNDVNTDAFIKEIEELNEIINKDVQTGLPPDVISIILKDTIVSEGGSEAIAEAARLGNASVEFAKASKRPALIANLLSKPPGPELFAFRDQLKIAGGLLYDLYVGQYRLSEDDTKILKEHNPNLRSIDLTDSQDLTDDVLLKLAELPHLTSINLSGLFSLSLVPFLAACKGLRTVTLPFVNSEIIQALANNNPNIEHLHTPELGLTPEGYKAMQQLKHLKELNLYYTNFKVEKEYIGFLSHFPQLETVVLPRTFSQSSLETLSKQCPNLKNITFVSGPVDEGTLKIVDGLFPNLKKLYLSYDIMSKDDKLAGHRREGDTSYDVEMSPKYNSPTF